MSTLPQESMGRSGYKVVFVLTALVIMLGVLAGNKNMSNMRGVFVLLGVVSASFFVGLAGAATFSKFVLAPAVFRSLALDRTLAGEYTSGLQWSEVFFADGSTSYQSDKGKTIRGVVSTKNNFVCFSYKEVSGLTGGCFEIWKRSENCFDFYGTGGGDVATVASDVQKLTGQGWTARAWFADQPASCVSDQIS